MCLGTSEPEATSTSVGVNKRKLLWLTRVTATSGLWLSSCSSRWAVATPPKPPPGMTTRWLIGALVAATNRVSARSRMSRLPAA